MFNKLVIRQTLAYQKSASRRSRWSLFPLKNKNIQNVDVENLKGNQYCKNIETYNNNIG
jgi:hypothetical protein